MLSSSILLTLKTAFRKKWLLYANCEYLNIITVRPVNTSYFVVSVVMKTKVGKNILFQ